MDREKNIHVLLVDDEDHFRSTLAKRLAKRGFITQEAVNGEDCLAKLERDPRDIVILDIRMPGIDGLEVLRRIKASCLSTEVILLTGHGNIQEGVEGIKAGAYDYLTKPIEIDHLVSKIGQAHEKILREDEKRREAEFKARMEERMAACERLASLGTMATGVAHEINNPLAIIKESAGWIAQLLKKKELADMPRRQDFERAVKKIEKSVDRASRITHQLLGFVRRQGPVTSEINFKTLLEEAVGLANREATKKAVEIQVDVDPPPQAIYSDPYQLRQVIVNLLTNAIHATDAGGKIIISAREGFEEAVIGVSDTGSGIAREHLERIFEPFFTTKPPGEGTGLSLFVSRGIIERLGGTIEVESRLGEGSCFTIRLPRCLRIGQGEERLPEVNGISFRDYNNRERGDAHDQDTD
ncbi:MAG: response regulator [Deltaproteobacteria bacterium]|nr:response regulator [Deltaproteobacteria bacterium]MBW2064812.1 response regulator [Deltaproteobacteria bacterium]